MFPYLRTSDRRRAERGVALAELTIVMPVMLALLLVVFDFGRGFMAYVNVMDAARDGARAAMQNDQECVQSNSSIASAVQVDIEPGQAPSYSVQASPDGTECRVVATYDFSPILPLIDSSFTLPLVGTVGPLWDGTLREEAVGLVPPATSS